MNKREMNIEQGTIDFWRLTFAEVNNNRNTAFAILSSDEQDRAVNIKHVATQQAFIHTRTALRQILSHYLNQSPNEIIFTYNEFGKPFLKENERNITFSVSHTSEMAVIAIACDAEVGVDIEMVDRDVDRLAIAQRFFAPSEATSLMDPENADQFFLFWTLKEAILKATGLGISELLHQVVFELNEQPALTAIEPSLGQLSDWQVGLINHLPANCVGAYAIKYEQPLTLQYFDY